MIVRKDSVPILSPAPAQMPAVSTELRDQLLAAMPERDRIKFRLLQMAESRNEAYGLGDPLDFHIGRWLGIAGRYDTPTPVIGK